MQVLVYPENAVYRQWDLTTKLSEAAALSAVTCYKANLCSQL